MKALFWTGIISGLVYQVGLLILYTLRAISRHDGPWWLAFISVWEPWWYLPVPFVFLLVFCITKSVKPALAMIVLPIVFWLVAFGKLFWPNASAPEKPSLIVMTFNVRFNQHSPESVLAAIEQGDADVVALQELTTALDNYLWEHLKTKYPYRLSEAADWPWGSGIYSRQPLTFVENRAWYGGLLDTQEAILNWNGQSIQLLNFHPVPPELRFSPIPFWPFQAPTDYRADIRHSQVEDLVSRLSAHVGPIILACDCNLDPASYDYEQITHLLDDGFSEAGWGFGHTLYFNDYPNLLQEIPLVRIDYVFYSAEFQAIQAEVLPFSSSNHRPVVVKLVMP